MDTQIVIVAASLISSICSVVAIIVAIRTFLTNKKRHKIQTTIEAYKEIYNDSYLIEMVIYDNNGPLQPDIIYANKKLKNSVVRYLDSIEYFSVGINVKLFDIEIFDRLSGNDMIDIYYKLKPYIDDQRKLYSFAYKDFENMVEKLREVHNNRIGLLQIYDK